MPRLALSHDGQHAGEVKQDEARRPPTTSPYPCVHHAFSISERIASLETFTSEDPSGRSQPRYAQRHGALDETTPGVTRSWRRVIGGQRRICRSGGIANRQLEAIHDRYDLALLSAPTCLSGDAGLMVSRVRSAAGSSTSRTDTFASA